MSLYKLPIKNNHVFILNIKTFITSEKGLRLIDLSGKKTTAVLKAKDRIDLERHYNIKNELKDFGYTYLIFKKKIKKVIRDVKVKLGLKSK